jgi:hypothetical protein
MVSKWLHIITHFTITQILRMQKAITIFEPDLIIEIIILILDDRGKYQHPRFNNKQK